jgi:hypothetical protein
MSQLSSEDRRELLRRARQAVIEAVGGRIPEIPAVYGDLARPAGVFVTLRRNGRLMGCVGHIEADEPLGEVVVRCAIASALHDSRFRPVRPEDIPQLNIEISVLSPPERIAPEAIEVGRHGIIVARGRIRGLLLPQVATERNWNRDRFLEETCLKAGFSARAWKDEDIEIYAFTAEVFSEEQGADALPDSS